MNFQELLESKQMTGYALAKSTGIPYTTINDLINGRTIIQNISLKNAIKISETLNIKIDDLAKLEAKPLIEFRYFRNNLLHELKRLDVKDFLDKVIKEKEIDYYYKNNGKEYAYYLLALIDFLCNKNDLEIYSKRYNELRKEKLGEPFFVGSDLLHYDTIEEAEKEFGIKAIPEFKKFNIIEEDVFNVA